MTWKFNLYIMSFAWEYIAVSRVKANLNDFRFSLEISDTLLPHGTVNVVSNDQ